MKLVNYDIIDDSYYLFTCAELRVREIEFLDKNRIERMLKSQELNEFTRVLRDTVYSRYINDIESSRNFEEVIVGEYSTAIRFLSDRLKPGHQAAGDLLFLEGNLHNLKVIIKSIILDTDLGRLFIPILYPYEKLRNAALTGNYEEINPSVADILRFAVELIERQKNHRFLEFELEEFYLKQVSNSIEKLSSRLIKDYFKHIIDILNIKNIYRNKHLKDSLSFSRFLHDNGFLPKEFMMKFGDESLDFFLKEMERTDYADIVIKGTNILHSEGTFSSFEKGEDLFYLDFFDPVKYSVSNLERVFLFFLRKKIELKYLNIIFTGILYSIDIAKIKNKVEV
ncbi:MAG: hypothetical protein A2163_01880 [Actinobacteria bacterium RBG_13_35_12]|nr:MAG: hypothetical protein A2163_01880 [Actinobacteria bacterium RBG_13_35_12]